MDGPYIEFNGKNAKTNFEKDFFKLLNNKVFGKSMENVEIRIDVRLTCDESCNGSRGLGISAHIIFTPTLDKPALVGQPH